VDELGYRLPHQALVFVDEAGLECHVTTDDNGVFDGYITVRGSALSVRTPDGHTRPVRVDAFHQPALIDLVICASERSALEDEELALASLYDGQVRQAGQWSRNSRQLGHHRGAGA